MKFNILNTTNQNQSIMKKIIYLVIGIFMFCRCATSIAYKTPSPSQYGYIEGKAIDNGFPKQRRPWVVFSDRTHNKVNPTKTDDIALYKEVGFMEPLMVIKKIKKMIKVGEYSPDIVNDGKVFRQRIKVYGWLPKDRLLLWTNGLKNTHTGFSIKATLTINTPAVISSPDKYIEKDSVILYKTPDFTEKSPHRFVIGDIVYIYKTSRDREMFLVGNVPAIIIDSIKNNTYGWVSKDMLTVWGERTAIRVHPNDSSVTEIRVKGKDKSGNKLALKSTEIKDRAPVENIFPIASVSRQSSPQEIKYFTNPFDYKNNSVYNVLGNPVFYEDYRRVLSDNKKLNVVFVVDVSKNNRSCLPFVKSLLQELQLKFPDTDYFSRVRVGGVVYKDSTCGLTDLSFPLSEDYSNIISFFEDKVQQLSCGDMKIVQPVARGLLAATKLINKEKANNETNIIVVIGTTSRSYEGVTDILINAITGTRAKLIFFQTQSGNNDAYNDFVLLGEKVVVKSAQNIAQIKKQRMVNPQDILFDNNYSLSRGADGIYNLDYPKRSMTQGFVAFPRKGEIMPVSVLKSAIDSIIRQVTEDNEHTDSSLTAYFRSEIGVNNTLLSDIYKEHIPFSGKKLPTAVTSGCLNKENVFMTKGYLSAASDVEETGILLNEYEYEQLLLFYCKIYDEIGSNKKLNKRGAIRRFVNLVKKYNPSCRKLTNNDIYYRKMSEIIGLQTGFYIDEKNMMNKTLYEWKNSELIPDKKVLAFFRQYEGLSKKLNSDKTSPKVRIKYNGNYFYWLGEEYIPKVE